MARKERWKRGKKGAGNGQREMWLSVKAWASRGIIATTNIIIVTLSMSSTSITVCYSYCYHYHHYT